jgi:succinoglycan biosynthesis transport protein ExoP
MELRQIAATLWKWAWLIVLATAVAAASSWWAVKDQPPIYQTSTTLMVGQTIQEVSPNYSDFYTAQQLAQTYAELIRREPVLKATAAALGFEQQWQALQGQVSAALVAGTQLMEIRVVDTDPVRAKRIADEVARQLMATVEQTRPQGSARKFIEEQVATLPPKIEAAQNQIADLEAQLGETFSAREIQDLQTQISALEKQVNDWRATFAQYQLLVGDTGVNVLTVVEEAQLPTHPQASRAMMEVALAAAVGLMLAVGAAFLIEYLDDTVKSPQDVERTTKLSTFGVIIRFPASDEQRPLPALEPKSSIAEGYRVLRTNLQFAAMGLGKSGVALLVTSAQPVEGKTCSLANLGVSLAQAGRRVLLVDTDLRRPSLHKLFNLSKEAGLTSLLLEREADIDHVIQETGVEGLRVLPSGPVPANPAEVLGFAEMGALLERLRTMADYVLLDSPPVLNVADASVLAQKADGVLMVVEVGRTRTQMFERAVAVLQGVKARVLGTILTKAGLRRGGYGYDDYYYYYYSSYYSDEEGGARKRKRRHRPGPAGWVERTLSRLLGRRRGAHVPGAAAPSASAEATAAQVATEAEQVAAEAPFGTPPPGVFAPVGRTAPREMGGVGTPPSGVFAPVGRTAPREMGEAVASAVEAEVLPSEEAVVAEAPPAEPTLEIEEPPPAEEMSAEAPAVEPTLEVEEPPPAEAVATEVPPVEPTLEVEEPPPVEEEVAEAPTAASTLEVEEPPSAEEVVAEAPVGTPPRGVGGVGTPPPGVFAPAGRTAPRVPATASNSGLEATAPRVPATASNPELEATASRVLGGVGGVGGVGGASGAAVSALRVEGLPAEEAVTEVPARAPPGTPVPLRQPLPATQSGVLRRGVSEAGANPADNAGLSSDAVYAQAMEHYRDHEWAQARDALQRLKAMDRVRPDVDALLGDVEQVMKHKGPKQRARKQTSARGSRRPRVRLGRVILLVLLLSSAAAGALIYAGVLPMPRLPALLRGNQVQTYINRGYDFFIVDNYEEAIGSFNKALELDPNNAEAKLGLQHATQYLELRDLYAQARALMAENSFDAAIVKLETIIKADPWYKDADLLLSQCQSSQELEGLYEQALGYYNAGDWAKAADAFEGLQGKGALVGEEEINSKLFDCYLNEGRQQVAAADSRSAIIRATVSFNSALALSPNDLAAQEERQLASLYLDGYTTHEQADWRQAITNLSRIYAVRQDYAQGQAARMLCDSYTKLGDSYQANGQPQLALGQYRLVETFAECDQAEVSGKVQQVLALLGPATPSPTAAP